MPIESLQALNPKTVVEVLESKSPSLVMIHRMEGGEAIAKALLVKLITGVIGFFNVGKGMNDAQVLNTVNIILECYALLKPDDFVLCFNYAKRGKYGKVYDRIDGNIIFEWLETYLADKSADVEEYRRNQNFAMKRESDFATVGSLPAPEGEAIPKPDWFILPEKKVLQKSANEVKALTPEQILFNGFIKQFDKRWLAKPHPLRNGRWIKYRGKVVNVEDYMSMKAEQLIRVREGLQRRAQR